MSFSITIELSERDLEHFQTAKAKAAESATGRTADDVIAAASTLLEQAKSVQVPDFIGERLAKLNDLIAMLQDEGWNLPEADRKHVLAALVYFADPSDIIPDDVPVLGFLDDAIMIEICVRELRPELDAYDEFCDYREREARRRGEDPATVGRADWLGDRRDELVDRMHRRRQERDFGVGYGSSSGYGPARQYAGPRRSWRPGPMNLITR
jgi:uncharacterized membrane protein YkvA (DUF1232 family)